MADLDDFLLQEIFVRLPVKSLHRFKCVSKHWLSLISDTCFVHEYVQFQARRNCRNYEDDNYRKNLSQETFISVKNGDPTPSCLDIPSRASEYEGFSFGFIPERLQQLRIRLIAASHGHFYGVNEIWEPDFHLCSPLFKQWIDIPRLPRLSRKLYTSLTMLEFMCDDDLISSCSSNSKFAVKPMKFKVVKMAINFRSDVCVRIFSSETWKWSVSPFKAPFDISSFPFRPYYKPYMISRDGVLYWINQPEIVLYSLDLNDEGDANPLHLHYITLPCVCWGHSQVAQLGLCKGRVHLAGWNRCRLREARNLVTLSIWELIKEGDTDTDTDTVKLDHQYSWSLKHTVPMYCSHLLELSFLYRICMVYFTPLEESIVYLVFASNKVVLFDLRKKTELVCDDDDHVDQNQNCVLFVIPYWPLPLKTPGQPSKERTRKEHAVLEE